MYFLKGNVYKLQGAVQYNVKAFSNLIYIKKES